MENDLLDRGITLMEEGDSIGAMGYLNLYLKNNPKDPEAICARGICNLRLGREKKGIKDILIADTMGSNAASEFIELNNIKRKGKKVRSYSGVQGWLLCFCIMQIASGALGMANYSDVPYPGNILTLAFCSWPIVSAIFLIRKTKYAVLNVKILLSVVSISCLTSFVLEVYSGGNDGRSLACFIYHIAWLVYFFRSERVRITYGAVS